MNNRKNSGRYEKRFDKILLIRCVIFSVIIIISSLFEVSFFKVFGKTPAVVLCIVSAVGFICGEKAGGICGIVGGFFIDAVGSVGISISPVFYMLMGYGCGYLLKVFLRQNFLSFIIYSVAVGVLNSCVTLGHFAFHTKSLNIVQIFKDTLLPEFAAFMMFVPIVYFMCFGIDKLINKIKK
ncbi:MAG: hypothetical protein E7667_04090 [Ruminococcaceae bacterium]|nr:hypothetical protein [Oscillospiraceae bacterium]